MSCKCAKYEADEGRYSCSVSGDGCMYMIPDSKRCAEEFGEGPDADGSKCGECKYRNVRIDKHPCTKCEDDESFEKAERR